MDAASPKRLDMLDRPERRTAGAEEPHQVIDWLLAILRFAITRAQRDRGIVMATAHAMDRLGSRSAQRQFGFFARTSIAFCDAIAETNKPDRIVKLRRHLGKIENAGLRRAFAAALELDCEPKPSASRSRDREYLWRGLRRG